MEGDFIKIQHIDIKGLIFIIKSPPTPLFQRGELKANTFTVSLACSCTKECRLKPAPQKAVITSCSHVGAWEQDESFLIFL